MEKLKKVGVVLLLTLAWISVLTFFIWTAGAIYYCAFLPMPLATSSAIMFVLIGVYLFFITKPKLNWLLMAAGAIVALYLIGLCERPQTDRDWDPDHERTPHIKFKDSHVSIENFRNIEYRTETDFDVRYETFEFALDQITKVWFLVQRFIEVEGIAHTFLAFQVETDDGPKFFSVSVEIRRERGEVYSPIQGMYRAYELIYVIGDERDLIGVRTVMRPEDRIYMYPANATKKQARDLFLELANRANKLRKKPEFYNSLLNNCANNLLSPVYKLAPEPINWLDLQALIPGYTDRFALENGLIGKPGQSFEELREQSRIDPIAREVGLTDRFSLAIRKRITSDEEFKELETDPKE